MLLLISDTPVAGTVPRIAEWLRKFADTEVFTVVLRNYAHNAFKLPSGALSCLPNWREHLRLLVRQANAIFLHNTYPGSNVDESLLDMIFADKEKYCKVFFQCHSPAMEPPACELKFLTNYEFEAILAVAQGYGRFFGERILVPNIVPDFATSLKIEKENIIFVPHMRSTDRRWSNKIQASDGEQIRHAAGRYLVMSVKDVFGRDVVTSEEIRLYLQAVRIVIDDINTGLMHQTTVEGVKSGSAVISAADLISQEEFSSAIDAPPLPVLGVNDIDEVLELLRDRHLSLLLKENELRCLKYSKKYLGERRLAQRYFDAVRTFL